MLSLVIVSIIRIDSKGGNMSNVKEIIAANLTNLRKMNNLTQGELAERLNYTDKAISRWEHAETLPDIETLCKICDIYGIPFQYLLEVEHTCEPSVNADRGSRLPKMLTMFVAICSVWIAAFVFYIYTDAIFSKNLWTVFIWAVPLSALVCQLYNKLYFGNAVLKCVMDSILCWTGMLALYLQMLHYNMWMLFILCIPFQIVIVLMTILKIKTADERAEKGGR